MDNSNDIEIIELDIMGGDSLKPEEENNDSHSSGNGHSGKNNSKRPKNRAARRAAVNSLQKADILQAWPLALL